jgi:NitT/TauT family transport system permease protein
MELVSDRLGPERTWGAAVVTIAVALVVGVSLGLVMGLNEWAEAVCNPYVNGLYVAPVVALVPILILIGGATFWTRVAVVFLFAVFEIAIDTYEGVKATPDEAIEAVRSFGADTAFIVRHVVLPYDLPYIFTGLRLGIGRGIKGMIIAELIFDFANLGAIIRLWADNFRLAGVFAVVALLMLTGIVLTRGLARLEAYVIDWEVQE